MSRGKQPRPPRKNSWLPLGLALAIVALGVLALLVWRSTLGGDAPGALAPEISVAEAAAKRDAGAFILDVREPSEWEEYHIPGATLIPLRSLAERVAEVPRDREVVVVCRSGNRSQAGRDILREAGFETVTSMAGGMSEWRAAGHPTVSGP